ncbi:glycosyltransferase family 2 protein [Sulfitobacter aestuariivivens]|uniref:Glycosyltransferase family 2 protein n=1 Tax=Sulfitobacter aestuariivivens TaxID=2766981 RepID=A0A927D8S2_9RHOB|nr:glycosyltransferase family 2 protein [Sulfitobacter aestuariivivens]MBD3665292.1 glycosyltransferase family 2 protein [Sulfitobacter aestuariivivens]
MTDLTVSVIVVSRCRPVALKRCLTGISQLQFDPFEVIVVADPEGIAAAGTLTFSDHLKLVAFDEPNISAARNLGVEHAAGDIVAFIDDDAVPEPQWLHYLVAPANQSDVAALGGFVRGRNGISFQWRARSLDAQGFSHHINVDAQKATVLTPPEGRAVKTEGTNMAFRRDVLLDLGGFDTAFHYFLDETDVNMRLARAGHATAIAPLAEVHHGFDANSTRTRGRVPRDLFDIGASWAVFQRKHLPEPAHQGHWADIRADQRRRVLGHFVQGRLEPGDVRHLMRRLDAGYEEGRQRVLGRVALAAHPRAPFKRFPSKERASVLIATRPIHGAAALAEARERVKSGEIVTVLNLSPTGIFHQLRFDDEGFWMQKGGVFGRSDRKDPLIRLTTRAKRVKRERARVAIQRGLGEE